MRSAAFLLAIACVGACSPVSRPSLPGPRPGAAAPPSTPSGAAAFRAPEAALRPRAPVVIALVVDQLAAWVMEERLPLLRPDGGFARLAREGTYVRQMRFAHAACDTAPGHASLFTGAPPHGSGIFTNEVLNAGGAKVSFVADPSTRLMDPDGVRQGEPGVSLSRLAVPTLADGLRAEHPDAVILSLSLKDRGAVFGGGRAPTDAVWYDAGTGSFVTSTVFAAAPPPWLKASRAEDLRPFADGTWAQPLRPDWVRAHATTPDGQAGEGDYLGFGTTFPHALLATTAPMKAFRFSPFADRVLLAMGLRALDARKAGSQPTLLALSLSSNDYIGHAFGPDSWEAWDELDRLDGALAAFFAALDARFGVDGYAVLLTADHGVAPLPETAAEPVARTARPWCARPETDRWQRPCGVAERLVPEDVAAELEAAAHGAVGAGRWVQGVTDPFVVFTDGARALPTGKRAKLTAAVVAALRAHPGVDRVFEAGALPTACPPDEDESAPALVCRSHFPGSPVDLSVLLKPGSFFDTMYVPGKGTSHGSPYLFDRAVPLLVRAPARVDGGRVIEEPVGFRAFAKTASALLGIRPPPAAESGRSLARAATP